jgi:hypothetical protein
MYVDLSTSRPTLMRQLEPVFRQKGPLSWMRP